jgi:predicted TIM-barrel fold metal-dependent hydrolase
LFATHLISFVASGIFEEIPDLRICVMESGVSWLPTLMWKLDTDWRAIRREIPWLTRRPTEYLREHVRFTVEPFDAPDARTVAELVDHLGSDEMLMYASDFPHRHRSDTEALLADLSETQLERIRWSNAAECFRIDGRLADMAAAPA